MVDTCIICNKPLSVGETVKVERGLETLENASVVRQDDLIDFFKSLTSVTVHSRCRLDYTRKKSLEVLKRRHEDEMPSTSESYRKVTRTNAFKFKELCLFCATEANEIVEAKKPTSRKRKICCVSSNDFQICILKLAETRNDALTEQVRNRVEAVDLAAVGAKYHAQCYDHFRKIRVPTENTKLSDKIKTAMDEIYFYMEENEDSQFTLQELKDVVTDHIPADPTILTKLAENYGSKVTITAKPRCITIISFRDTHWLLSKSWYESRTGNPAEERLRIIDAAAAIVAEDICSIVTNNESYPPAQEMFDNINQEIPETLLRFMHEVLVKQRKGNVEQLTRKCTALSHAIMAARRPRSFKSQLLVGLSVFLHRTFGSRRLIELLASLGFSAAYEEAVAYQVSTVYHPQPHIIESNTLVQYVGDNADINVHTLDGYNTFHVMGMIKIITPASSVVADQRIARCTKKPSAKDLAAVSHVPVLVYENYGNLGMKNIAVQPINFEDVAIDKTCNLIDLLWMYGKSSGISGLPGWNGFLENLSQNNTAFSTSCILFLPFIRNSASSMDTIYTTLDRAVHHAKSHNQKSCIVTFDQPLYWKAREIVASASASSDMSKVVVRLGGFHMIMSFLGCIGHVMDGSGIKEAISTIYAPNSVDKMLNGHAYARAIRCHMLVRLALSKITLQQLQCANNLQSFWAGCIEDVMLGKQSYENLIQTANMFDPLDQFFHNKIKEFKDRGPTAQLWIQYIAMVSIAHDFIRAERTGNWKEHLLVVKKMLPYFHASGHFLYATSGHLYLQDMIALEAQMDSQTYQQFSNGFFTVRRTAKFNSGTWTDMVIEQSQMKVIKQTGGLSSGRSTTESVESQWIYGLYAANTICATMATFCNISMDTSEQHHDARDSRIKRDNKDVDTLSEWFKTHDPFPVTNDIVSISTGVIGDDKVNCFNATAVGLQSLRNIVGQTFNGIKLKRSIKVLPLSTVNNSVTVHECKVAVDPLLLFQRICLTKKFEENLKEYIGYELSPYPTSLFDGAGLRKTSKSTLYKCFDYITSPIDNNNIVYIVDGGFLLHRVVWHKNETFSSILNKYMTYVINHYGSSTVVVFDGYSDNTKNIKAMEQRRRTALVSSSCAVRFDETMEAHMNQEKFLANNSNKRQLIAMLIKKLNDANIGVKQARDDADVLIVETAIDQSSQYTPAIVGEDIDLLVILLGRITFNSNIIFKKPGKGKVETKHYSTACMDKYPNCLKNILFLHALTGCDTTSAFFHKGKIQVFKMFEKRLDLHPAAKVFMKENCCLDELICNGMKIILAIHGAPKTETCINNYRYLAFAKASKLSTAVKFSSLPPTSSAAQQHLCRVYYQVQTWLGKDIDPEQWGWIRKNDILHPVPTQLPPAPDILLNSIFCNCTKGCAGKCSCRKVGLNCSTACGHCHGQSCLNAAAIITNMNDEMDDVDSYHIVGNDSDLLLDDNVSDTS